MSSEKALKPVVPSTLDGWSALHELYKVDWNLWRKTTSKDQELMLSEAMETLNQCSKPKEGDSAYFSMLGHKGDLLFLHFRKTFDELNDVELSLKKLKIMDVLQETTSYVSVIELGLYEMTVKLSAQLLEKGLIYGSDEWKEKWREEIDATRERMKARIYPQIPERRYLCFYPMNKKRGEQKNWYDIPIEKRQEMMRDHGMIGRKYAGRVTQIISGSIGFDDWEWGVDLFADDPKVFKELIYEMRFDEASSHYAEFGPFYTGLRFQPNKLPDFFSGKVPSK